MKAALPDRIPTTVLFREIKERGYDGGETRVKLFVRGLTPLPAVAPAVRFETTSGRQMQADWATDGGGDLPLTQIKRQSTPARSGFKSLQPHQSLDAMQPAWDAFRQQIVPNPPSSIGPIAGKETHPNLRAKLFICGAADCAVAAARLEPTSRDTERPAHPIHGPDPPVLRNKAELHVDSFAK
jgi:hypothetical protein